MYRRGAKWYAWNPLTGKQASTGCTDKKAASLIIAGWERAAADPTHRSSASKTLAHAVKHLADVKRRQESSDATLEFYDEKTRHLARIFGENTPVADISADRIDDYISKREEEGAAPNTIYKELVALRQLLKAAHRKGWCEDPGQVMPVGYSPKYKASKVFIHVDRWWDYIRAFPVHRGAEIAYQLATGANESEVRRARREHVTRQDVFIDGTKRESRKRHVPITGLTRPFLEFALKYASGKGGLLFDNWAFGSKFRDMNRAAVRAGLARWVDPEGKPLDTITNLTRIDGKRVKLCEDARLVNVLQPDVEFRGFSSNDMRRSFGSALAQAGVPFEIIAKCMGHESTRMVYLVYGQMRPQDIRSAVHRYLPDTGGRQ
jgi:integrase